MGTRKRVLLVVAAFSVMAIVGCSSTEARRKEAYNQGKAALNRGDFDAAIRSCTEAIRLDPKYIPAYYTRALAYAKKGDYDKAIADQSEVIRLDPEDFVAYCERAMCYLLKRDYDRAMADCTEAIRIDSTCATAYSHT